MAVQFHPRLSPFLSSPKQACERRRRLSLSAVCAAAKSATASTAILWYKHDLRLQDHPGLVDASRHDRIVPIYILDRRILGRFSDEMVELLLFALEDLRNSLQQHGSNLMIRVGRAENVMVELAKDVQASSVFIEEEIEHELRAMLQNVKKSLSTTSSSLKQNPEIVMWRTPFYDAKSLQTLPWSFDDFQKLKPQVVQPLVELPKLPANAVGLPWGDLPSLAELKEFMNGKGSAPKEWAYLREFSAADQLQKKLRPLQGVNEANRGKSDRRRKPHKSAFVTSQENLVGGGAALVLNALAAYLRYLEGTARDEFQEVHEKIRLAEKRQGASFDALFRGALSLGIVSRRQVHYAALKYEKERNGGFLSPFGYSTTTVAAAIESVSSMEWYWLLALKSQEERNPLIQIWRWNSFLIQYTVAGDKGPAVLLVHGFGAFLEHYRDNTHRISEAGNRVWAITLLGFGKSEKPNVLYTELMWAELIRDFIIEVVGEPAHLIGNSIGGYIVSIVAGLWPSLAKSIALVNTAGNIVPGYTAFANTDDRRISAAAWLGARFLLAYLRFNIRSFLKRCYPTRSDRADNWLVNEMIRASYDPGATFLLESIFSFDLSHPLNYLLEGVEKKVLVIQGMKDPLLDPKAKLALMKEHFKDVTFKEIDAGHCPHDERPDEVNLIIKEWVEALERNELHIGPQSSIAMVHYNN